MKWQEAKKLMRILSERKTSTAEPFNENLSFTGVQVYIDIHDKF